MKNLLILAVLLLGPILICGRMAPAHAADEAPAKAGDAKPDAAKPDAAKGEEGGKEEGKAEGKGEGEGGKKKGSGDVSGGKFAGDPVYVRLAPIVLPIIAPNGVEQLVTVQITVEVKDFDVGDDMHTNMPRVMDALNQALYGGLGDGSIRNGKMVNVDKIKARATAALQKLLGADNIKEVLIVNLSQRML